MLQPAARCRVTSHLLVGAGPERRRRWARRQDRCKGVVPHIPHSAHGLETEIGAQRLANIWMQDKTMPGLRHTLRLCELCSMLQRGKEYQQ